MFGQEKVKGHNRIIKGKSGFKVTRIGDFLRKKDEKDNTKRNIAIGTAAVIGAGGIALLLKKKGIGISSIKKGLKGVTTNTPKYPQGTTIRNKANEMLVNKPITNSFDKVPDPWSTPIKSSIKKEATGQVIQQTNNIKALPPAKAPSPRTNLKKKEMLVKSSEDKVTSSVVNMRNTQKNYDSLPTEMKAIVQIEKALVRPIKSGIGRPPDTKGLKTILDDSDKTPIEKVVSKAKRKVSDRLKRQNKQLVKREEEKLKKNSMT